MATSDRFARFVPKAVQLGAEEEMLERAHERLDEVDPGSIVVLPEYLAWTRQGSVRAYLELSSIARGHGLTIVTTLNLPPDITEDLPDRDPHSLYDALVVFTRHGDVHVPQAKVTPQPFETSTAIADAPIGVAPYHRLNLVQLDLGEELVDVRFLVGSDLWLLTRLPPEELACDLWIVPGGFPRGAEACAARVLAKARAAGLVDATLLVNAHHESNDERPPVALAVEELIEDGEDDGQGAGALGDVSDEFRVLPDDVATSVAALATAPAREGRIAVPRSRADEPVATGRYVVTIAT